MMTEKICAVIVTFNRLALLQQVLSVYDSMPQGPDCLIVVDNHSSDGTTQWLQDFWFDQPSAPAHVLINLPENIGGSGGFYVGQQKAIELGCDWVWLADDDAFPETDVFQLFRNRSKDNVEAGAYCTTVINHDQIDTFHRRCLHPFIFWNFEKNIPAEEYDKPFFPVDFFSYVGTFISKTVIDELGMTEPDYFIWFDDSEHALRISRKYRVLCMPSLKVHHDVNTTGTVSWKDYYGIRNRMLMYRKLIWPLFLLLSLKTCLLIFAKLKHPAVSRMFLCALVDAWHNKKGIHPVYKPGFKFRHIE